MAAEPLTVELEGWPRAIVTKDGSKLTAVFDDIEDLDPQREPNTDESTRGIQGFNPPTVSTEDGDAEAFSALCGEAVSTAIRSTLGELSFPDELVIRHKVTFVVHVALRGPISEDDADGFDLDV